MLLDLSLCVFIFKISYREYFDTWRHLVKALSIHQVNNVHVQYRRLSLVHRVCETLPQARDQDVPGPLSRDLRQRDHDE